MASTSYDEKPKDGDLIEIFRGSYQHWAVYVGDGFVVHLTSNSEGSDSRASSGISVTGDTAIVKKEELWKVVGSNKWKINNSLDKQYKPRPAHVIVRKACAMVGNKRSYNIAKENCEHFANELRYGKKESRQVLVAGETLMVAGGVASGVTLVVTAVAAVVGLISGRH